MTLSEKYVNIEEIMRFKAVVYFCAVMMAPCVVFYGMVADSWFYILTATGIGGWSLYAGLMQTLKIFKQLNN